MEKLRVKTFYTIFFIISTFIVIAILFFNIQSYQKEYSEIEMNLNRISNLLVNNSRRNNMRPDSDREMMNSNLDNRIIMDYNVYTFLLDKNNNIIDKISHNENGLSDEILIKATNIISESQDDNRKISSLYFNNIAYNFASGNFLIIVDTSFVQQRLVSMLGISIFLLSLFLVIVYFVSKKITEWITKPVEDSFNKQKEFIANASHELKTPLSVIIASIDCLEVNRKNTKWVNNLKSESERMNNLITRLLDLSRSESFIDKDMSLNDLSKIVEKRTLTFESLAFESKVLIESDIEKNIMMKCNQSDIDELVGVLIDNAIKHSFQDSKIKVNLYKEKNNVVLDIINRGEEIPKEEIDKIFERFYRSDKSRNRNANRYGLGLAIAKNIVTNYNGEIKVLSNNGYTTFKVILEGK